MEKAKKNIQLKDEDHYSIESVTLPSQNRQHGSPRNIAPFLAGLHLRRGATLAQGETDANTMWAGDRVPSIPLYQETSHPV